MQATIRSLGDYHNPQPVPVRESLMAHHRAGLTWTATGYGARIPSRYMVQINGKWRRVYFRCFSNTCTMFIGRKYDGSQIIDIWKA
jgi:hypothetical protein